MTRTLIAKWTVRPDKIQHLRELLPELGEKSKAEPGNIFYTIYQSETDAALFVLHERYENERALERHRQSEHYQRIVVGQINLLLTSREVISVRTLTDSRMEHRMPSTVLFIVSNTHEIGPHKRRTGNFLPEVAHPFAEFDRAGYQIDFASLTGETPYLDALNLAADPDNLAFLVGKGWASMQKARKLSDVDVGTYDAIFMPGGLAPMVDMPEHPLLKRVIRETYERGAVVSAVCHGPVSLLNVKLSSGAFLVAGKNISSFTTDEENGYARADVPFDLESALTTQGAIFHKTEPWAAFSIADGTIVTGQNPASAKGVAEKVIGLLEARQTTRAKLQ